MPDFDITARILHRDAAIIVLDKPAGIAVHAGSGKDSGIDRYFGALRFGEPRDPALAHRLDKDTSGCLVLGRTREALAKLGKLFQTGRVGKTYWAVVAGRPAEDAGIINAPLARRSHDRRSWVMKIAAANDPAAETAVTRYRVLAAGDGLSLLELNPETGRTHQLRVHCDHIGCPIAGDPIYGGDRARALARHLHLHARRIVLPFGHDAPPLDITAPVPEHMQALIRLTGFAA
jgi:RluA family pseudouridine synthase